MSPSDSSKSIASMFKSFLTNLPSHGTTLEEPHFDSRFDQTQSRLLQLPTELLAQIFEFDTFPMFRTGLDADLRDYALRRRMRDYPDKYPSEETVPRQSAMLTYAKLCRRTWGDISSMCEEKGGTLVIHNPGAYFPTRKKATLARAGASLKDTFTDLARHSRTSSEPKSDDLPRLRPTCLVITSSECFRESYDENNNEIEGAWLPEFWTQAADGMEEYQRAHRQHKRHRSHGSHVLPPVPSLERTKKIVFNAADLLVNPMTLERTRKQYPRPKDWSIGVQDLQRAGSTIASTACTIGADICFLDPECRFYEPLSCPGLNSTWHMTGICLERHCKALDLHTGPQVWRIEHVQVPGKATASVFIETQLVDEAASHFEKDVKGPESLDIQIMHLPELTDPTERAEYLLRIKNGMEARMLSNGVSIKTADGKDRIRPSWLQVPRIVDGIETDVLTDMIPCGVCSDRARRGLDPFPSAPAEA